MSERIKLRSPCKIGDLVQIKVGHEKYLNGLVTRRVNNRFVVVRYNTGKMERELTILEKVLYTLNKTET